MNAYSMGVRVIRPRVIRAGSEEMKFHRVQHLRSLMEKARSRAPDQRKHCCKRREHEE